MRALDRLLTIVVTATLTSAVWIVAGGTILERAKGSGPFGASEAGRSASGGTSPDMPADGGGSTGGQAAGSPLPSDEARALIIPVRGKGIRDLTDTFTQARGGGTRIHEALDIMADEGTPVIAAAPGTVEKLFLSKAGGNTIYVRSANRQTIYYYAHLKSYAPGLAEGRRVIAGQDLGQVGHTGNASPDGPHLHFAILRTSPQAKWWETSTPINPYPLLTRR
jgi:murein DD-endopeptidase MepM/ murein hydrolase activator NlpD